jgi:hypothetical protein
MYMLISNSFWIMITIISEVSFNMHHLERKRIDDEKIISDLWFAYDSSVFHVKMLTSIIHLGELSKYLFQESVGLF